MEKADFACKCGCGYDGISPILLEKLRKLRARAEFRVTSGCRCEAHNRAVGGVPQSSHIKGLAADITSSDIDELLTECRKEFKRIGVAKTFLHVDVDTSKVQKEFRY